MTRRRRGSERNGISIKWKLFSYMALFTLFVLVVVWVFQVLLLGRFYEHAKQVELVRAADSLSECLDDNDSLVKEAEKILSDSTILSKVYKIGSGNTANLIMSQDWAGDYYIKKASPRQLQELFNLANKSGGTYIERRTAEAPGRSEDRNELIYVRIVEKDSGVYIIMLNVVYTPLGSTVYTLNLQFGWIAVILLLGAFALTMLMSVQISAPIVKMNASAKKLAKGNYDAEFSGEGYREIRELSDTLNYASSELAKTDDLRKDLLASVSHDLRTPLTMITGYAEVMRDIPDENTPENVQVIIDESKRLTDLVNDMLDLSKLQAGTARFEKCVFNLTETVRATLKRYSKLTERDGFRIEFESDRDVYVRADLNRMLQVIYNLINNALNYSGDDKYVKVEQTVSGGKVKISVSDNGAGIAPEDIPYIWDRYYKVDKVHSRAVVGTGLGLSIVKNILERHGATYGVESVYGRGSTFWFELPEAENDDL